MKRRPILALALAMLLGSAGAALADCYYNGQLVPEGTVVGGLSAATASGSAAEPGLTGRGRGLRRSGMAEAALVGVMLGVAPEAALARVAQIYARC